MDESHKNAPSRYDRHIRLKAIGSPGQEAISGARILVAGLGALGSTTAMLAARSGVGFLRIVDKDQVEPHNLHRQTLYTEADVGARKADAARARLRAMNSEIEIDAATMVISPDTAADLIRDVDLVIDGLDNVEARYVLNDAVCAAGIPYVFGGVVSAEGNLMTILPGVTPCLRCLWPDPAQVMNHDRASTVGVLASAASTVASMQFTEAVKIMVGRRSDLLPGLLIMDLWNGDFQRVPIPHNPHCTCRKSDHAAH